LRASLAAESTRFLPVVDSRCPVDAGNRLILDTSAAAQPPPRFTFLGLFDGRAIFSYTASGPMPDRDEVRWLDLRELGAMLPAAEANLAAHAIAMHRWQRTQNFCSHCGAALVIDEPGYSSLCSDTGCGRKTFPRVDPAIIVLVSSGDACLLGRQAAWPSGRYSTIAGFVEPGESLEDAVRREVFEETNVPVGKVWYRSSQPWPFPSALMLGFRAEAPRAEIVLNDGELEDAGWFERASIEAGEPRLPPRLSIARALIDEWVREAGNQAR
jgi:NAD+ diphosphatase